MTDILQAPAMRGFIRMCMDGWDWGWHERNGGNLTYRMTDEDVVQCRPFFKAPGPWVMMDIQAENLAGSPKGKVFSSSCTTMSFVQSSASCNAFSSSLGWSRANSRLFCRFRKPVAQADRRLMEASK